MTWSRSQSREPEPKTSVYWLQLRPKVPAPCSSSSSSSSGSTTLQRGVSLLLQHQDIYTKLRPAVGSKPPFPAPRRGKQSAFSEPPRQQLHLRLKPVWPGEGGGGDIVKSHKRPWRRTQELQTECPRRLYKSAGLAAELTSVQGGHLSVKQHPPPLPIPMRVT